MKDLNNVNINSVNLLYLIINQVDEYIEESNGNRYLTLAFEKLVTKYTELG